MSGPLGGSGYGEKKREELVVVVVAVLVRARLTADDDVIGQVPSTTAFVKR